MSDANENANVSASTPTSSEDIRFMRLAIEQARVAADLGEVPIGAVVVKDGEVIASGCNLRETDADPAGHAEFIAMHRAARKLGAWRLSGCTVYVTVEPCLMCAGLMHQSRIDRCVYGAPDAKAGALGSLYQVNEDERLNHRFAVTAGVLADECAGLLKEFFSGLRAQRKEKPRRTPVYPLVSIIIPFYNACDTIARCLDAILGQNYRNLEVILVNDGSTDASPDVVREVCESDARVKLVDKPNTGVSDSRNKGLDVASGEWVYFVDADDWMVPEAISTLVEAAQLGGSDLAVTDFFRIRKGAVAHKHGPATGTVSMRQFLRYMSRRPANHYFASLWNKLFKRSVIEEISLRFDTGISFGEDHVFILEYLRRIESVSLIDRPLYFYIDTDDSLVHRGLGPIGVVKMKWKTYKPYRHLFAEQQLYRRPLERRRIYKYIFMPCTDHFVDIGDAPFDPRVLYGKSAAEVEEE